VTVTLPGHPPSWYAAATPPLPRQPALEGAIDADACIVGGGYTGLSAALHLAGRGYRVVLLEAERIGWGASGRNGGQIGTGPRQDEADIAAAHGADVARQLFGLAEAGKALVRDLVAAHGIDCDLRTGQIIAAAKPGDVAPLHARAQRLARDHGYRLMEPLDARATAALVGSSRYAGGVLDLGALHLQPLAYALGLARAALAAGVAIFEGSRVLGYSRTGPAIVRTARGQVRARHVVLACNGYLGNLEPRLAGHIMPINNFLVATAPLPAGLVPAILPRGTCAHDTLFVLNYFRRSADGRLVFGGGENYGARFPADIATFVRPFLLRVFPQLADVAIDHAWGGTLAITRSRLPHVGRLPPNVFFAHGYSGHGVANATLAGQLIAEAMDGTAGRFDVLAGVPARRFPGGRWLRWPGMVLGMLYYALRDRL
jgi:gamma-glutamylputrescine oxidase